MSAKYYTMEFIINDIVYVSLREKIDVLSIDSQGGHFKVKGHDHMGLWVEHPGLEYDFDDGKKEEIDCVFLIPWSNIQTIMHFPNKEGFDFEGVLDKKKIGFTNTSKGSKNA
tara:strand:+ start:89 stop:424 length:336 start_codon:yes stop_codon:yes gene_type:complete